MKMYVFVWFIYEMEGLEIGSNNGFSVQFYMLWIGMLGMQSCNFRYFCNVYVDTYVVVVYNWM